MVKKVAYVLRSFPELSETFIAEEAASLIRNDVQVCMLQLLESNAEVAHPSVDVVFEFARFHRIRTIGLMSIFAYLMRWVLVSPLRTLQTLFAAAKRPDRWCYMQALLPAWWCRREGVEFLHAHFADVNFQYAAAISAWTGVPYGVTTHGYDLRESPLGIEYTSKLFRAANVVITISDFNRRFMQKTFWLSGRSVEVVHCGIDLKRFSCGGHPPLAVGQPLRILNVGRLVGEKGQDTLIKALYEVRSRGIPCQLDIVGEGGLRADLQELAERLQVVEHVHLHGAQPESFVRAMHGECHVFVLSSRAEGLPVVCIEALALCTPTIATRITGIPELIKDNVNGMLVEPDAPSALADVLARIYHNPNMLERFRVAGRQTVVDEFDRRECTRQLIGLWAVAVNGAVSRTCAES